MRFVHNSYLNAASTYYLVVTDPIDRNSLDERFNIIASHKVGGGLVVCCSKYTGSGPWAGAWAYQENRAAAGRVCTVRSTDTRYLLVHSGGLVGKSRCKSSSPTRLIGCDWAWANRRDLCKGPAQISDSFAFDTLSLESFFELAP